MFLFFHFEGLLLNLILGQGIHVKVVDDWGAVGGLEAVLKLLGLFHQGVLRFFGQRLTALDLFEHFRSLGLQVVLQFKFEASDVDHGHVIEVAFTGQPNGGAG